MPYVRIEPDVFMEHKGVSVFHVYRSGTAEPWTYWFTTNPATADDSHAHGEGGHFDVRMLTGLWTDTPSVAAWDGWWGPRFAREHEAIVALIEQAIDEGRLPQQEEAI